MTDTEQTEPQQDAADEALAMLRENTRIARHVEAMAQAESIGRLPLDYGEEHKFEAHNEMRRLFNNLATEIVTTVDDSRHRSIALTHLEDAWFRVAAALGDME